MDFLSEINVNTKEIALKEDIDKLDNSKLNTTDAAASANKINTDAGSVTQPVYFKDGVPVETTYTLAKSVPSDAVFTDTKYTHPSYTAKSSGLYKVTVDSTGHVSAATAVTKADITNLGIPASDTNTHYASKNVVNSSNTSTSNTTSALTNGNVYLISVENGAVTSAHKISGSGATTVTTDASGNIVISSTDTNTIYTHPTTSGNKHIPSGGSSGQILRWSADGTAVWGSDNNTTYSNFVKSGSGAKSGLVPAPSTTAGTTKYLREDGTWSVPPNTTYTSLKNPYALTLQGNGTTLTNGTYDGSAAKTVNITPSSIGAAASSHTHNYAGSSSAGGIATSANKWATARNINGLSVDGSADRVNYGTCSTAAATAAKTVACTGFALVTGAEITVKFTVTNTATSPTLNVNNTGAKAIYYRGAAIFAGYLAANHTYTFRYNGTQYELSGDVNTNNYVTQTNTTTSADYRMLLSGNSNDTTETTSSRKSSKFLANPSTGEFYAGGYRRIDISNQTLDVNNFNLSSGAPMIKYYVCKTSGGSNNISNIPVTDAAFLLDVELIRWVSTWDYITMQTFRSVNSKSNEYVRFCVSGTWGSWTTRVFTDTNTKVNVTLGTTTKAYLLGTSTTPTSTATGVTAISDTGVYLDTTAGKLTATTFAGALSGNASSATKWATARNINGLSVDGTANRVNYGTCSTAAATAAKVVACTGFSLVTGAEITVKFTVTNTAASPTLNVNSTGAKAIYYRGSAISAGYLAANRTYTFRYNGTQYDLVGDINTDTNTDTKNTTGASNTSSKIYLIGATSQSTNPVTYSHDTVFVDSGGVLNSSSGIKLNSNGMYLDSWANFICGSSLYSGCSWHMDNSDGTNALKLYPHEEQKTLEINNRTKFSYGARVYSGTLSSGSATVTITNLWEYTLLIAVAYNYGYLNSSSTPSTDHVSYTSFTIPIPVQYINGGKIYTARLPIDEHVYSVGVGSQIEISKSSTANSLLIKKRDDTTVKLGTWNIYAVI